MHFAAALFRAFLAKEESWRRQHRDHRLTDALLELLSLLRVGGLRQRHEPVHRLRIDGTPVGFLDERLQNLARILAAGRSALGRVLGEEAFVVLRAHPILRVHRPAHGHRIQPHRERPHLLLVRRERMDLDDEFVIAGFPILVELVVKRLATFARVFLAVQLPTIRLEDEPAFVVVELIIHEPLVRREVEQQLIAPGVLGLERVRGRGGVVIRKRERVGRPLIAVGASGRAGFRPAETSPRDDPFCGKPRHGGHGPGHDGPRRSQIFLQQHRWQRQHVADVIEAVAGIIGRKFLLRVEVHAHEVADRVPILDTIEPPHGHAAGVEIRRVRLEHRRLDPLLKLLLLLRAGLRLLRRRHDAGANILQRLQPEVMVLQHRGVGLEFVEGNSALVRAVRVAIEAELLQQRTNLAAELGRGRRTLRAASLSGDEKKYREAQSQRCFRHLLFELESHEWKTYADVSV